MTIHTKKILSSNRLFYAILILAAIQGLWYALSFQPFFFDEGRHLGFIFYYSNHLSPFIAHQSERWDFLGEITRDPSYLFYYLMSFPLRLIELATNNYGIQVVFLRLLMIASFITGLFLYRKVFSLAGLPKSIINIALLFLILTPSIAPLIGAVNYDNVIFLLLPAFLLFGIKI